MQAHGDDAGAIRELASDLVAGLCRRLRDGGVESLHFYTLNLARPTLAVLERLKG
jgi:methylenetetrahydrofolate reductase (NADPH)